MTALELRVERLERDNRRFKRGALTLAVLIAGCAVMVVVSWAKPSDEVRTRRLVVLDGANKERVVLNVGDGTPALVLLDAAGGRRASLAARGTSSSLELYDEHEAKRAELAGWEAGSDVVMFDGNGKLRATLGVRNDGAGLALYDDSEHKRAALFTASGSRDPDGSGELPPMAANDPGLVLYDRTGAPCATLARSEYGPALYISDAAGFESVLGGTQISTVGPQTTRSAASLMLLDKRRVIWQAPK